MEANKILVVDNYNADMVIKTRNFLVSGETFKVVNWFLSKRNFNLKP